MQGRPGENSHLVSRRTALRGAAGVAGAAWLVPVITVVSMDSASAASAAPPRGGGPSHGTLAFTGSDTAQATLIGVATLATGAAAVVTANQLRKPGPDTTTPPAGRHRSDRDSP